MWSLACYTLTQESIMVQCELWKAGQSDDDA